MRITRDALMKVVRDTVAQRTRNDRNLLAVYLHGSLLGEDYLLGGTADIDLFFVHSDEVQSRREILALTDDVHLDIAHFFHRDFRNTRQLRIHPWIGPTLKDSRIQFDPQHFLDFTQASVRGQYDQPDYVVARSRSQVESAREHWLALHALRSIPGARDLHSYLQALEHAANAVASLTGPPLTERRFLLNLPARCEALRRPGLYPGLLGLLGATNVDQDLPRGWLTHWLAAYQALDSKMAPPRLHPARQNYYLKAIEALLSGNQPHAGLWPLLRSWTLAICSLAEPGEHLSNWQAAMEALQLTGKAFAERVAGLDAYLDMIEETLDQWAIANGAGEA